MKTLRQLLTQTEYAKHRGSRSRTPISRAIKKHRIPLHDGKIDPAEADPILDAMRDRSGRGRKPKGTPGPKASNKPGPGSFGEAQAKREHYKALLAELDYRKRSGELVEVAAVEKEAFRVGRQVRDALMALPDRLAGVLAAESNQHEVHAILLKEVHQSLEALK